MKQKRLAVFAALSLATFLAARAVVGQEARPGGGGESPKVTPRDPRVAFRRVEIDPASLDPANRARLATSPLPGHITFRVFADVWRGGAFKVQKKQDDAYYVRAEVYDPAEPEIPIFVKETDPVRTPYTPGMSYSDQRAIEIDMAPFLPQDTPYTVKLYLMRGDAHGVRPKVVDGEPTYSSTKQVRVLVR